MFSNSMSASGANNMDCNEKELWERALVRYERIELLLRNLLNGIGSLGNDYLNIPACSFCDVFYDEDDCFKCPWEKELGKCDKSKDSAWEKLRNTIEKALYQVFDINDQIKEKLAELENSVKGGDHNE